MPVHVEPEQVWIALVYVFVHLTDAVPVHVEPEQVWIALDQTAGRVEVCPQSRVRRVNQPKSISRYISVRGTRQTLEADVA